jgi:hypothetical protein
MASFEPPKMVDYPPELLQAVVHEAPTDAWRLAMFLQQLGLAQPEERDETLKVAALVANAIRQEKGLKPRQTQVGRG